MSSEAMLLTAEGLHFRYGDGPLVVRDVSLSLERGQLVGLVGPNGCGKSTLLRLLGGMLPPQQGTVHYDGRALDAFTPLARARHIAYVPQGSSRIFPFTALEIVLTGRTPYGSRFRFENDADRKIALEALEAVGAVHLAARPITELSGGEQQLIAVARALAKEGDLLLLDEPASSLDLKHRAQLLAALRRVRAERMLTALIVTHDLQLLERAFHALVGMRDGEVLIQGEPSEVLQRDTLRKIYDDPKIESRKVDGHTFVWSEW